MEKIYYPYPANDGKHKYYIITKSGKKIKFGAYNMSDFTHHKDEARKQRYINRHKKTKHGLNQGLIQEASGPAGCYGIYQTLKKVTKT